MNWIEYKNLSGKSGIIEYAIEENRIWIKFNNKGKHAEYYYPIDSIGENNAEKKNNMEKMKELAQNGKGLNSFINKNEIIKKAGTLNPT